MADSFSVDPSELTLRSIPDRASRLIPSSNLLAQAWQQVKQTPQNVSTITDALHSQGIDMRPPDQWEIASTLRSAKDRLVGLWRGYIAPALR